MNTDKLADLAAWVIVAAIAWRLYRAVRAQAWDDGFRAGFNAVSVAKRATKEVRA